MTADEPRPGSPSRWLGALARLLLPRGTAGDEALGDLHEDYHERRAERRRAARWSAGARFLLGALALLFTLSIPTRWRSRRTDDLRRHQENRTVSYLSGLLLDLRTALRSLRRRPLLTAIAVVSLTVGLGANTAIFSLVNVLFLRPLPGIPNQESVVEVGRSTDGRGFDSFNYLDFEDLKNESDALQDLSLWRSGEWSLAAEEGGRRLSGLYVTPSYFRALGVRAERGRLLREREEDDLGERGAVVISHRMWQTHFGGDESIVGSEIQLNRRPFVVVGVTDPAFHGHVVGIELALFAPMSESPELQGNANVFLGNRRTMAFNVLGALVPGHAASEADAEVRTVMQNLAETYPESNGRRSAGVILLGPVPGAGRGPAGGFTVVLMALVVLLLCATCANVAGILTAKALSRERELGTRLVLGCGRARLVQILLLEAILLALAGGGLGLGLTLLGTRALDFRQLPVPVDFRLDLTPDLRVFGFGFALAVGAALLLGLPAALQASTRPTAATLVGGGWRAGATGSRWRRVFVAVQVAGASVLALVGGLFLRSLERASHIQTGFDPSGVVVTRLDLSLEGYESTQALQLLEQITGKVEALPGVSRAAFASDLPLDMNARGTVVVPESWDGEGERSTLAADFNQVSPGYFEALHIPRLAGRPFTANDRAGAERVAVVSRTFAERWPEGADEVLGARFRYGRRDGPWTRVVGIVEDTKNQMLMDEAKPFVYVPLAQEYESEVSLVARSDRDLTEQQVRSAILEIDPSLSLSPVVTLGQLTGIGTLPQRMAAILGATLGGFSLLLAALGIYGVIAFQVAQRAREIGLRMALGEARGAVTRRVLLSGVRLVLPGLVVGALAGAALGHLLRSLLLGISPLDPVAIGVVLAAIAGLVLAASFFPARRAASVDPAVALRNE